MKLIRWISASAGTGKTYQINELVDALVQSGVDADSILCLSFTRNSAFEMQNRYSINLRADSPRFETIHSFAMSIIGVEGKIITDETINELIKEAIEFVISKDEWFPFFESIHENWSTMIADIKHMTVHNNSQKHSTLNRHINKHINKANEASGLSITLSNEALNALRENGLETAIQKIISNDPEIYANSVVTKDFRVNKKLLPESFINNPKYLEVNKEIDIVLQKILNDTVEQANLSYLRQSAISNLFIKEVSEQYQEIKSVQNLIDFNDIIFLAIKAMSESSEKIMRIKHIFLDEAQDTSEIQWKLIYSLVSEVLQLDDSSFTVVGDRKQIIYEFNGASKILYDKMKVKFKTMIQALSGEWQEYELNKSYRSPQTILDFIDTIMQTTKYPTQHDSSGDKLGYIKTWLPVKTDKQNIVVERGWRIPGEQILPQWIDLCISELKKLLSSTKLLNEDRDIEPGDIMILIPRRCINTFLLIEEMRKNNIPICESPFGLITDETIQELIAIGEIVMDINNELMIAGVLKSIYFKWTNQQLEDIATDREDTLWNEMCISELLYVKHAVKVIDEWLSLPKDLLTFYSRIIFHSEYGKCLLKHFRNEVLLFWEKLVQHSSLSLSEFIFFMKNTTDSFSAYKNGVCISTVHGSKGREAPIVFLCNSHITMTRNSTQQMIHEDLLLLKGNYSIYKNSRSKGLLDQENESDRLLYVALTRAKEQLYILPPLSTDNINPKSWYSKIIRNINLLNQTEDGYEIGINPFVGTRLTKYKKYN